MTQGPGSLPSFLNEQSLQFQAMILEGGLSLLCVLCGVCVLCAPIQNVRCNKMLGRCTRNQYMGNPWHTGYCRKALNKTKKLVSPHWGLNVGIKQNDGKEIGLSTYS